jgi:hypothetical protein
LQEQEVQGRVGGVVGQRSRCRIMGRGAGGVGADEKVGAGVDAGVGE